MKKRIFRVHGLFGSPSIFLILLLLVVTNLTNAQTGGGTTVTGKVVDKAGKSLPAATVTVKGSSKGTTTDAEGSFSLKNVKPASVLLISFQGYETISVEVKGTSPITISLKNDVNVLNDVVVVGYGRTIRRFRSPGTQLGIIW